MDASCGMSSAYCCVTACCEKGRGRNGGQIRVRTPDTGLTLSLALAPEAHVCRCPDWCPVSVDDNCPQHALVAVDAGQRGLHLRLSERKEKRGPRSSAADRGVSRPMGPGDEEVTQTTRPERCSRICGQRAPQARAPPQRERQFEVGGDAAEESASHDAHHPPRATKLSRWDVDGTDR